MVREGAGDVDELLGLALMRKVLGEIFRRFWNRVIEENLGGFGFSPLFFILSLYKIHAHLPLSYNSC